MKGIRPTSRFLRDLKQARKRGKDIGKIETVIDALARGEHLAPKHFPHPLKGRMKGLMECHVEPDWLLIWEEDDRDIVLVRCGTHADLFE